MRKMLIGALAAGMLAVAPATAAVTFTAAYVFGDSLSDRGNAAAAIGGHLPNPPYYHDSFTNGDVAVQVMAQRFGLNADASLFPLAKTNPIAFLTGGTNYSFSGAAAGTLLGQGQPGANLADQITYYLGKSKFVADPNALYTVFMGGNDVRRAAEKTDEAYVTEGISAEGTQIQKLLDAGVKHLLVVNVPDIGTIPEYALETPDKSALATQYTVDFNTGLTDSLSLITAKNSAKIYQFDLFAFNNDLLANAGKLGITNTTDPCYTSYPVTSPKPITTSAACGPQAANIDQLFFWDDHHPTAKVQFALGNALADFVLQSEVPEPASWVMMLVGFGVIGAAMRRRKIAVSLV